MFAKWRETRRAARALIESDADRLVDAFGPDAYFIARRRASRPETIDADREPGHWGRVKLAIARKVGHEIGAGADRR